MLFTSIFSFPHNVFKKFFHRIVENQDYVMKGNRGYLYYNILNPSLTVLSFGDPTVENFLKHGGKGRQYW